MLIEERKQRLATALTKLLEDLGQAIRDRDTDTATLRAPLERWHDLLDDLLRRASDERVLKVEEDRLRLLGRTAELENETRGLQARNSELLEKIVRLTQAQRAAEQAVLDAKFAGSGAIADRQRLERELHDERRRLAQMEAELEQTRALQAMAQAAAPALEATAQRGGHSTSDLGRAAETAAPASSAISAISAIPATGAGGASEAGVVHETGLAGYQATTVTLGVGERPGAGDQGPAAQASAAAMPHLVSFAAVDDQKTPVDQLRQMADAAGVTTLGAQVVAERGSAARGRPGRRVRNGLGRRGPGDGERSTQAAEGQRSPGPARRRARTTALAAETDHAQARAEERIRRPVERSSRRAGERVPRRTSEQPGRAPKRPEASPGQTGRSPKHPAVSPGQPGQLPKQPGAPAKRKRSHGAAGRRAGLGSVAEPSERGPAQPVGTVTTELRSSGRAPDRRGSRRRGRRSTGGDIPVGRKRQ